MPETITEETINLANETLVGDIRDFLLDRVKNHKKPWVAMSETEQHGEIHSATEAAKHLVRRAVNIIASEGRKVITGHLEQVTVKKEIKAVVTLPKSDECRHELIDSQGQSVLLVVADTAAFSGEGDAPEPDPDQGDLIENAEGLKNSNVKKLKK